VNVLDKTVPPAGQEEKDGKTAGGASHVLIVRTPTGG
jgi:hypothetical protein